MMTMSRPCMHSATHNLDSLLLRTRRFAYSIVCCTLFLSYVCPLSFNITHFESSSNDIIYDGDARILNGVVELTKVDPGSWMFRTGRMQYSKPMDLWDSSSGRQADFSTRFSFIIDTSGSTQYSDGLAFFLAPVGYVVPPNSGGGFLGLFNSTMFDDGSPTPIVTVEFDTFSNSQFDPPTEHIGINNSSLSSLVYAPWNAGSHSGNITNVLVTYNSASKNLSVFWSFDNKPVSLHSFNSSISSTIDLAKFLPESVAIGFSASYGVYSERHTISSWEFSSNLDVPRPPSRQFIATAAQDMWEMHGLTLLMTVSAACFLFSTIVVGLWLLVEKKKKNELISASTGGTATDIDREIGSFPMKFSYQELSSATNGFAKDRRLGQGGSGQVYKGTLSRSDRAVAVKRIFAESKQSEKVFLNEVRMISQTKHRNLVQLIGWSQGKDELFLVYEYMPNGSLDNHLFGARKCLPWDTRYKIVKGLASAINYLHEELAQCVLHRDIKAANILLDMNFVTKLGDFGVAKLVDPHLRTQKTVLVGTYGYMAPEYIRELKATSKSDIFSFGVVILEIACGRRSYQDGEYQVPLHEWVWRLYLLGRILDAADKALEQGFDPQEMECLLMVGLWCAHPDFKRRPNVGQVIQFLQLQVPVPALPHDTYIVANSYRLSTPEIEPSIAQESVISSFSGR